jgi:serine/threonine-protein kinase RsbW
LSSPSVRTPLRFVSTPAVTWSRNFPAVPAQIGSARQFLARVLDGWPTADDAALCLSELVANAILHSRSAEPGGQFTVRVQLTGHDLRVEVADGGGPWVWTAYPDEQHGRGLLIVGSLAQSWGQSDGSDGGRTVWYEMTMTGNCGLPAHPAIPSTARRGLWARPSSECGYAS